MDETVLRAWWAERQGLMAPPAGQGFADVLARTGWARSVGGANPYLTLQARAGGTRAAMDEAVEQAKIHELPSARGCTYVVPACDYALALLVSQGFSDAVAIRTAKKYLGVTDAELAALEERVLALLGAGPLDPKQLREGAGDAVRNLGPEGKKRGVTTTLPLVLGSLQSQGRIRRIPITGRLDQERYRYALWEPSPLTACGWSREEALTELARRYFTWIGPATLGQFQWFSGLGVRAAQAAVQPLGLRPVAPGSDWLLPPELEEPFRAYRRPEEPCYALVASLDGIFHLRRDVQSLLGSDLEGRLVPGEGALRPLGGLADLSSHAILDRGELVGIWEFDPGEGRILWQCFRGVCPALPGAIARTEAFVREQLGDARSYSMDTPASREFSLSHLRAAMSAP